MSAVRALIIILGVSVLLVVAGAFTTPNHLSSPGVQPPQTVPDWEDPSVIGIHKERPRASAFPFEIICLF